VRFNFSKDTLYIDEIFAKGLLDLIENLSVEKTSRLKHIAIDEFAGANKSNYEPLHMYWAELGGWLDKITGLQSIQIVPDVVFELVDYEPAYSPPDIVENDIRRESGCRVQKYNLKGVELFPKFPEEPAKRLPDFYFDDDGSIPFLIQEPHTQDWIKEKKVKFVWGWRHLQYPKPT
jgi:hypothetical protein